MGPSQDIAIVGRSCRLPGAASVDELWSNLVEGRCSVTQIPADRWSSARHGHPRQKEPGKSYVWAAGILEDVWDFDPTVFGISPREAEQMDPQQRLMLELTWEALESAGMQRPRVGGTEIGVFVGASSTEYQVIRSTDTAGIDAYTATGAALSIISNRISHAFDFRGPSFTVDTACSSSLVALHQAMEAIRSGGIDTAVVGGVNLLLGPLGFVLFSQATMLSPTGRCRSFDAAADGYVRAEGGVVLVLKSMAKAVADGDHIFARLVASGANSDGRTNGIALPSRDAQTRLLRQVYARAQVSPGDVLFVEAHGTGTRVGDPIEAMTIGDVLGSRRSGPLRIGSIKSNIGHLEPASGLAGVLKAMLALEHDLLPASINVDTPNPDIPFAELGLEVATAATELPRSFRTRYAGVNSFGFGGANAHVIVADPPSRSTKVKRYPGTSDLLALSAATAPALRDLARRYAERLTVAGFDQTREVAAAAAHRREPLAERLVIEWDSPRDLVRKLERIADREDEVPGATFGTLTEADAPVAFVFSGNGGQWPGMGRGVYRVNRRFREAFDEIDALFDSGFGWSVTEAMFANDVEQRLRLTHIAQPLIFGIQVSTARALAAEGLEPSLVIGHSVGEIAAATISGALTLADAVRVIHARSSHQEIARDAGRMAVVAAAREQVEALCEAVGNIEIAAENTSRNFTVVGTKAAIKEFGNLARRRRVVFRQLDLDYPFHSRLIGPVREPLLADLRDLATAEARIDMISTVTGEPVEGTALDGDYWWRNVREPVRFSAAIARAAERGARIFVEIGPRSVLLSNIADTLAGTSAPYAALTVLERKPEADQRDPVRAAAVAAYTRGAAVNAEKLFGPEPTRPVSLPAYPWQRRSFRPVDTSEATNWIFDTVWHRLAGARVNPDAAEWTGTLDTLALPELADHEVGGHPILPAAAFIEIALSVGRDWLGHEADILELSISQPMPLEADRAREIRTRVSPATGTLEILSRPRLSRAEWQLHAAARLAPASDEPVGTAWPEEPGETVAADVVYRAASAVGLRYGPAFRLLRGATRLGGDRLLVDLQPSEPAGRYGIDPARLDACFHGLFVLLGEFGAEERGTAFIPVRFGHVRLLKRGAAPARALIELVRAGESALVADFTLFDESGTAVAHLHEARFQAAHVKRANLLAEKALVPAWAAMGGAAAASAPRPTTTDDILAAARTLSAEVTDDVSTGRNGAEMLIEGWASSAAFEIVAGLSRDGRIPSERMDALDPSAALWLTALLRALEANGLAGQQDEEWVISEASGLPPSPMILETLAAEHPEMSAELLLAGRVTQMAGQRDRFDPPSGRAVDGFERGGVSARGAAAFLASLMRTAGLAGPGKPGARILLLGHGPLSHLLAERASGDEAQVTILDLDPRRRERARLSMRQGHVEIADGIEALAEGAFDLILSAEGLHGLRRSEDLERLARALAPGGHLVAMEPSPSLFRDAALGLLPGWFDPGSPAGFPFGPLRSAEEWAGDLRAAGLAGASAEAIRTAGASGAILILAEAPRVAVREVSPRSVAIHVAPGPDGSGLAERLDALLSADGHDARLAGRDLAAGLSAAPPPDTTLLVVPPPGPGGDCAALRDTCLAIKACAEGCPAGTELWIVAGRPAATGAGSPVVDGILAFARTLANESPTIVVRRVEIAADTSLDRAGDELRRLLSAPQRETDILIGPDSCRALRFLPLDDVPAGEPAPVARLERCAFGGLSGLAWQGVPRALPGPGEVEIAVEATGLNFRDVMWAMSLLPDDILEDGFAGASLGLECAGRVVATGPGVARFAPGDRVVAFAPSAFATSVTVPVGVVSAVPAGWSSEAAAGMPVAFLTAYYGLVTLAGLRAGEWVLVHGAAGGVGLAAIQIARWRGATVVATAGSPEKRALLRSLGVEHVFDSRSTSFADDLRRLRRGGVDVVLNSLSGEAMERSIGTLGPFGRFVELGKRDYVANTMIGLRPFRRNLSYFGVDVDQLLSNQDRAAEIFAAIMALFEPGELRPLPYRVFGSGETLEAFRLMQQSGHIGKIVVRPPEHPVPKARTTRFAVSATGTHLVTGGFGGFGLEAARWLADRGARHLVLVGRSGAASPEAGTVLAELDALGVRVLARACDVSDETALSGLLAEIGSTMPPLAGILHGAMVLEDGLVEGLTAGQLDRVFAPKVGGAANLDRLLGSAPLDYFVLFSSITTFIGNPGQSAYVAANAYLEGLARERVARGRPGLALAWGAISDVGILAQHRGLAEALSKRVGVKAMPAREALDLMAQALARQGSDRATPVLAVGSLDWAAARRLPALSSPTFSALMRGGSVVDAAERVTVDLTALVASRPPEDVRQEVADIILSELATVLRIPKQDVNPTRRLSEIGLDSLMAIELATALQDRLQLHAPPGGSVSSLSASGLADHLIATVQVAASDEPTRVAQALNERHAGIDLDTDILAPVLQAVSTRGTELSGLMK